MGPSWVTSARRCNFDEDLSFVANYYNDLHPLQIPEPFLLARITFEVHVNAPAGTFLLQLMDDSFYTNPPADGDFDVKGAGGSNILSTTLVNGSVKVPEPSPLALMLGAGLVGLVRRRWSATRV